MFLSLGNHVLVVVTQEVLFHVLLQQGRNGHVAVGCHNELLGEEQTEPDSFKDRKLAIEEGSGKFDKLHVNQCTNNQLQTTHINSSCYLVLIGLGCVEREFKKSWNVLKVSKCGRKIIHV